MTRFTTILLAVGLAFGLSALSAGCEGGGASCEEACESAEECGSGLDCFSTKRGQICLPSGCAACFDSNRTCSWEENTEEQAKGEMKECSFRECD